MIVLKLGGSVITDKSTAETIDEQALNRAAEAVAATDESLVLVHGGGSFGHPHAERHGVSPSIGTHDPEAITAIHRAMTELTDTVVDACQANGAPALPVRSFSIAVRDGTGSLSLAVEVIDTLLAEEFLPVLSGDVVAHRGAGATVLSGDELTAAIATRLAADRVGLCSAVPGVLDADGTLIDVLEADEPLADSIGESDETDVTGGMAAKIRSLRALESPASIFDLDGLSAFLSGESPGTLIR